ncbi:MAG: C25 family cysteine peptidase [Ferruginibacter sp.]|nr:hypothetical protein [Ferruginibacter sp.]
MIKKIVFPFLVFIAFSASAQFNNSWIDYSKTYYKFKLATDNICRIPQAALVSAGLGATNADYFQLWRNGQQVRLFTSVNSAPLGATDFIEFWGEMNDGKADAPLYNNPQFQLADRYSLETDTATYFLTVNSLSANLRYTTSTNTAPSASAPEPYFMRKVDMYYKNQINRGFSINYGTDVFSASYDNGEGMVSNTFTALPRTVSAPAVPLNFTENITNLNVYTSGPTNSLSVRVKGFFNSNASSRDFNIKLFNNVIYPSSTTYGVREFTLNSSNLPLSYLQNTATASFNFYALNLNPAPIPPNPSIGYPGYNPPYENLVLANIGLTYPALFNFNNEKSFYFELAASGSSNYLVIDNFNYGSTAPILYDLNTNKRYIGEIASTPGKVKFVLPASSDPIRKFILNNVEAASINSISNLAAKTFVNYNTTATRGDYIIISNPSLYNDGSGTNNVELYRAYRSTANGGGFNAKIYDVNELRDQFAFGIKTHPDAIRNFIQFIDAQYPTKPKFVFLMGKGITYYNKKAQEANPIIDKLDLVSTFGWPASDILLVSKPGTTVPIFPVGRLGAINGTEVGTYLQKVQQYEQAQQFQSPAIIDKAWMKNVMQIVGGKTPEEYNSFNIYVDNYTNILKDTFYGGHVEKFNKTSSAIIQQATNERINKLFEDGLGYINYFGHSSATTFEFNLGDPTAYNNAGKYPFFNASGCTAGDYYQFEPERLNSLSNLSDKFIFTSQRGSIGFLAGTHFGLANNLDNYNTFLHKDMAIQKYGLSFGEQMKDITIKAGGNIPTLDYASRIHLEELNLHGDPAIKIHNFAKADYVIEPQLVTVSPSIVTVADASFKVKVKMLNIGKAVSDSIRVYVKRLLPNTTVPVTLIDTLIPGIRYEDSLNLTVPINPVTDVGLNKISVMLDHTLKVDELYETNNGISTDVFIFENSLLPVYPYNYSIVNSQNITYTASTANPLIGVSNYTMEIDTTELFNSPFKKTYNKTGIGGAIEFTPANITFTDSTVYYWRTAVIPTTGLTIWNNFSFVYLANSSAGFNQSHYYQYLKSTYDDRIFMNTDRKLKFKQFDTELQVSNGNYPPNDYPVNFVNLGVYSVSNFGNAFNTLQFVVLDGVTASPLKNLITGGLYGSNTTSATNPRVNQFQFPFSTEIERNKVVLFLNQMPNNATILLYPLLLNGSPKSFVNTWSNDAPVSTNLYNTLKSYGLAIDSFYRDRPLFFKFVKNNPSQLFQKIGNLSTELMTFPIPITISNVVGEINSPLYGPAKSWSMFHWRGNAEETATKDSVTFKIIGVNNLGVETTLLSVDSTMKDVDISSINATLYPFIKIKMTNVDSAKATPYQLRYWRVNYTPVPEGAVAPNILYTMKDTVEVGEPIKFSVAFKNVSAIKFDSLMKINLRIKTNNNFDSVINMASGKILLAGDTLTALYTIPSENYIGNNTLFIDFNPNNHQPEQTHVNNVLYKNFYVKSDKINPLMDVTFDGVHILNRDIVASKPDILIKIKDESKFLNYRAQDTGLFEVKLVFPDRSIHVYKFNNDTIKFIPANIANGENTATINLKPYLKDDGDYELFVKGRDRSGNTAGAIEHHSVFTVINKAMISEMLNYPNPFTTSTAFVFTLTGSQVPQNLRIQILTITGKIVKEISKAELGPIHVGRNITDYKWDGTDTYGQKLANGVYIYRVITNLNGKSLEKYKADDDNTGKYFNKGYGKMYLMR